MAEVSHWLEEQAKSDAVWFIKRLSANDTLANDTNQAGPYIPKDFLFDLFPSLATTELKNPDIWFEIYIDSHSDQRKVRAIYYNNKFHENPKNGRNETRLTNFGGRQSVLLDPESTGSLVVFSFRLKPNTRQAEDCRVWVCRSETEEAMVEDRIGPVEPGRWLLFVPVEAAFRQSQTGPALESRCSLAREDMPPSWMVKFPLAIDLVRKATELRRLAGVDADTRLMQRRECEYQLFRSVEEAIELPHIVAGFKNVEEFVSRAQTILQRRKARAGRSLELHTREILLEERLVEGVDFSHQPESEDGKSPDFLFPSEAAYKDTRFPRGKLRMLAVKTTCKDRWRQILNEADHVQSKHLLTLQEGVSESQFLEMSNAGVQLVVPASLIGSYPKEIRGRLQSLKSFIEDVRHLGRQ